MNTRQEKYLIKLARAEGWEILETPRDQLKSREESTCRIIAEGRTFRLTAPYHIHLRLYRDATDSELKFQHMKALHDLLWPGHIATWNSWEEQIFRLHCEPWKQVILAGGASSGKSASAAKVALIFWLSDPRRNGCIIASTTLESLESRIWGYCVNYLSLVPFPLPAKILSGKPPKILHPQVVDKIHGMFAVAVRQGADDQALSTVIGRHPENGLLIVLDEATDLSNAILKAIPNLESGDGKFFQLWAIGNSNSRSDLHGSLATPKRGWDSVDPMRDDLWETKHNAGICYYLNPYKSPAITDPDPAKRARLSKFLITAEGIESRKITYGSESDSFYRFVLGFWKSSNIDESVATQQFLNENQVYAPAEWSGFNPLRVVAGLDPAYQIGGRGCLLRLAIWGHSTSGKLVLDYRDEELLFRVEAPPSEFDESAELKLAKNIVKILREYNCPVSQMAMDASGVGRALGELIRIVSGESEGPMKVVAGGFSGSLSAKKSDPTIYTATPTDMWMRFKLFIQHKQIRGLDVTTAAQLINRRILIKNNKLVLETKSEYQGRMNAIDPKYAHSPDEADAAILALLCAYVKLGFRPGQEIEIHREKIDNLFIEKLLASKGKLGMPIAAGVSSALTRPPLRPNFSSGLEDGVKLSRLGKSRYQ